MRQVLVCRCRPAGIAGAAAPPAGGGPMSITVGRPAVEALLGMATRSIRVGCFRALKAATIGNRLWLAFFYSHNSTHAPCMLLVGITKGDIAKTPPQMMPESEAKL